MTLEEVNQLSSAEKRELIGLLWDSMNTDSDADKEPAWYDSLLEERAREADSEDAVWVDLDEAFQQITDGVR